MVKLKIGDRIKVTDTFLAHKPYWTGIIIAIDDTTITIAWDDSHEDTVYPFPECLEDNKIEVIP